MPIECGVVTSASTNGLCIEGMMVTIVGRG